MQGTSVILKSGRDVSLRRKHPWIFSGAIKQIQGNGSAGALAVVLSAEGEQLGSGYLCDEGSIAVKMLSFSGAIIDEAFFEERVRLAWELRQQFGLGKPGVTDAYRLINAEGDSLPGLIVDVYGRVIVIQCQSLGMNLQKQVIVAALCQQFGNSIEAIVDRSHEHGSSGAGDFLFGSSEEHIVHENGLQFFVDWQKGQKTGFFLDQRENRELVRQHAAGREVLNAFSYTGGFSVYALSGGAKRVESVDTSQPALDILQKNITLNSTAVEHTEVCEDFLRYMQELERSFDLIVLDPPAFAKKRSAVEAALRGYRNINSRAIERIRAGGLLFTFSCSQLVSRDDFRRSVLEAALQSKREVQIVRELHQAPCHPVSLFHAEGDYLKGLMLHIS